MINRLKLGLAALALCASGAAAQAQEWADKGKLIASFYNETMSVPKGWELTYTGLERGVEVYTFIVRPETVDTDTSWLEADGQLQRVLCGDDTIRAWVQAGMKARADKVVIRGGKREVYKGSAIIRCS